MDLSGGHGLALGGHGLALGGPGLALGGHGIALGHAIAAPVAVAHKQIVDEFVSYLLLNWIYQNFNPVRSKHDNKFVRNYQTSWIYFVAIGTALTIYIPTFPFENNSTIIAHINLAESVLFWLQQFDIV